jgi:formylglycine-generating enzyme required for sulfatase activity
LSASAGDRSVTLSWTDPSDSDFAEVRTTDFAEVRITWTPEDGGSQPVTVQPGTESATITGLTNGTEYTFTLKTVDTAGNASSGVTTVATPAAPPSAPSNLQLSVVSDTQIDLSWTDNAANETGFEIERDGTVVASDVAADTESYSDTGLSSNTSYDYRVRAVNAAGASAWTDQMSATTPTLAGDAETFSAGGESFNMHYVPPKSFPTGGEDGGTSSVADGYWIARTEVTYELWYTVREWAENGTGSAPGEGQYSFANAGREGNDGTDGAAPTAAGQEPVTFINWRDAMLWTNALTEWYNAQTGASLEPVYYPTSNVPIVKRVVSDTSQSTLNPENPGGPPPPYPSDDRPYVKPDADGFRLPTKGEWELAARYIDDSDGDGSISEAGQHYDGGYASGATGDINDASATGAVAWYDANSGNSTHEVAQKTANALGLHDMSGNIAEWNFDQVDVGWRLLFLGGSWDNPVSDLQVGLPSPNFAAPYAEFEDVGFRPVRNAQ